MFNLNDVIACIIIIVIWIIGALVILRLIRNLNSDGGKKKRKEKE